MFVIILKIPPVSADEKEQLISGVAGVDDAAPVVSGALFNFPNTVENRIIRLVGLQVWETKYLLIPLGLSM